MLLSVVCAIVLAGIGIWYYQQCRGKTSPGKNTQAGGSPLLETSDSLTPEIRDYLANLDIPELTAVLAERAGQMVPALLEDIALFLTHRGLSQRVIAMLENTNADVRAQAAELLGYIPLPGASEALVLALGDKSESVRLTAASSLIKLKDLSTVNALAEALGKPGKLLPARVAEVLLAFGNDAVMPLIDQMMSADIQGQALICEVLGQLGDPRALEVLTEILKESSSEKVRAAAAEALGSILRQNGAATLPEALLEALKDSHWTVRAKAAEALGQLGNPDARQALKLVAEQDEDWNVQAVARAAADKL